MKYFVICPYCGQDLLKAGNGSLIEITCPECDKEITVEVKDFEVIYSVKQIKNKL